jgi:hypothetical protein
MTIAQNLFKDDGKKDNKGRKIVGNAFVLHHCYEELGNEEKWRNHDGMDVHAKGMTATEAEVRRITLEERMVALEEKKVENAEHERLVEEDMKLFCTDTSNMDEKQKEYINLARDEVLAKKRLMANYLKAQSELMRGFGGIGGYGGMGAAPAGFGCIGGYGGYGGMGDMGGMGAMGAMGGI